MGCGIAHFGRGVYKPPKLGNSGLGTMCIVIRGPWVQNPEPKLSSSGGLQTPPTKTSNTTPHYYPKYEI